MLNYTDSGSYTQVREFDYTQNVVDVLLSEPYLKYRLDKVSIPTKEGDPHHHYSEISFWACKSCMEEIGYSTNVLDFLNTPCGLEYELMELYKGKWVKFKS